MAQLMYLPCLDDPYIPSLPRRLVRRESFGHIQSSFSVPSPPESFDGLTASTSGASEPDTLRQT